jgi:hypothetical protein
MQSHCIAPRAPDETVFRAIVSHARFYPIRRDKSPACRDLQAEPTTDYRRILQWEHQKHVTGFAAQIQRGSRLFVLDLEAPDKKPELGPYGMMELCTRLDDRDITLPPAPTTITGSGGYHLYFTAPASASIFTCTALWPGVDLLTGGANVILPGSVTLAGTYRVARNFTEAAIPKAPDTLIELLESSLRVLRRSRWDELQNTIAAVPTSESGSVHKREWFRLWRNKSFASMWNLRKIYGDTSKSAYEFHLAGTCFCNGLSAEQTLTVLRCWWRVHNFRDREPKFTKAILPDAWKHVEPYVEEWKAKHNSCTTTSLAPCAVGRPLSESTQRILSLAQEYPEWRASRIAVVAGVSRQVAANVIRRHGGGNATE